YTDNSQVPHTEDFLVQRDICLIPEEALRAVHRNLVAIDLDLVEWRRGCNCSCTRVVQLWFGDLRLAYVVGITKPVAHQRTFGEIMLSFERRHVDVGLQEVGVAEAIVVLACHRRYGVEVPRNAVIRYIVFRKMEIANRQARGRLQAKGKRGSKTETT